MSGLGNRIHCAFYTSVIGTLLASFGESLIVSSLQATSAQVADMARQSFLFRWLTKEPELEVIVIDLRKTWTVGTIIRLLDWLIARATPYWEGSALKRALDGAVALGERAVETRAGQLVAWVLMPPEPPEPSEADENP